MVSIIYTWVATIIALLGTILNCKQNKVCFYLWIVTNAMWLVYDFMSGLYSRCTLDFIQLLLAIYGVYEWNKIKKGKAERVND